LVLQEIQEYSNQGTDFGFETTLSGKSYYQVLKRLKSCGYKLHLFFLWLPSPELSIARIKGRVAEGGHNIPSDDVRRRFGRGIRNFFDIYEKVFDTWMVFDNSGIKPALIAESINGVLKVTNIDLFMTVKEQGEI
jgi:predicted ABC-type ATPase